MGWEPKICPNISFMMRARKHGGVSEIKLKGSSSSHKISNSISL